MKISKSTKINEALEKIGIIDEITLINHLPRSYSDFTVSDLSKIEHKMRLVILGTIEGNITFKRATRITIVSFNFLSNTGRMFKVVAFNRPYLYKNLVSGHEYTLIGIYDKDKHLLNLVNIVKGKMDGDKKLKPIYSLPNAIENYQFHNYVNKVLNNSSFLIEELVPPTLKEKYRLISRLDALKLSHNPKTYQDIHASLRTLKYEECLLFSLQTQMIRSENKNVKNKQKLHIEEGKILEFINQLPFKLTSDQYQCMNEIIKDMNDVNLMYRLLQGDVGTGKTLVAAIALYAATLRGEQALIMAPTEALARQHFKSLCDLFNGFLKVALLTGSMTNQERLQTLHLLKSGEADVIIGTHALFSRDVEYKNLGLVIIDEQHRFGVNQRLLLAKKGEEADLLLLSATPIPRTLSLTLFGDLDISTLTQFPQGKRHVVTKIVDSDDKIIINEIKKSLEEEKRIFIIAPLIEYNDDRTSVENLYIKFNQLFKEQVGLLHGKLPDDKKLEVLQQFINGVTPILIATTIIEVGIDVKNANLMVVYDATNFGLASLHQIRGRVGRDGKPAKCLLVTDAEEEELEKLRVLEDSLDGFKIAEMDLKLRGPGDLNGLKQSGLPSFNYVNIIEDFKMFEVAREDAKYILNHSTNQEFKAILRKAYILTQLSKFTNV